jgi:hypothetical protein
MINWQNEYRSRKLIAKLVTQRVEIAKRVFFPADYDVLVGLDKDARRTIDALKARRQRATERHLGATFDELNNSGRTREYLDADELALPVVDAVREQWA